MMSISIATRKCAFKLPITLLLLMYFHQFLRLFNNDQLSSSIVTVNLNLKMCHGKVRESSHLQVKVSELYQFREFCN